MQSVNLKSEQEKIKELIRSKSSSEIKKYLNDVDADKRIKDCIEISQKMHGLIKDIDKDSNQLVNFNKNIQKDVDYMIELCNLVKIKHKDVEIKYDFCELQGFDYENDVIFSAYIEKDSQEAALGENMIYKMKRFQESDLVWTSGI